MMRWHVVNTHPRAEGQAHDHLARQGFEVFLPRFMKRRRHARRVDWRAAPLFPGYVFVRFDPLAVRWRPILSTVGVRRLVCRGDEPASVPEGIVEEILARRDERGLVVMNEIASLKPGDRVQIMTGAFSDLIGLFDAVCENARVAVLLDLLGRKVRVKLPEGAISACA